MRLVLVRIFFFAGVFSKNPGITAIVTFFFYVMILVVLIKLYTSATLKNVRLYI